MTRRKISQAKISKFIWASFVLEHWPIRNLPRFIGFPAIRIDCKKAEIWLIAGTAKSGVLEAPNRWGFWKGRAQNEQI